jgi:site-specific DNA-methyltransferase (adenine-specific)
MKINEIYLGDCLELMPKHVEDKSIDMIFCDLPYGTTQCKWDSVIDLGKLWKEYKRVIKDNGAIVLNASQPFTSALVMSNPKMFKYEWIWQKSHATGHLNSKKQPMRQHESLCVFYKKQCTYNPQMIDKTYLDKRTKSGDDNIVDVYNEFKKVERQIPVTKGYPKTIQYFATPFKGGEGGKHPTQKPLSLIEYMIRTYTNEGDLILDNTCGSGTTGVGAKNLNRNYIMMEQDPKYYEIACKRLQG